MIGPSAAGELAFGRFRIDARSRAVWADGAPAHLTSRAFDVLLALAEHDGRTVAKRELLDTVWGRTVVEDSNLSVHISALRKLFGADVIATIPGRGYRFVARLDDDAASALPAPSRQLSAPGNLPAELPPLYGREAELQLLGSLLAAHRLVTLTGAGGIGKTRLALAAAHALRDADSTGTSGTPWLVELAALADPALLPGALAGTLGLSLRAGTPVEQLAAALSGQRLLLVLDNCEHLLDATAALLQALLDRVAGLRVLATSREPLKLPAEQLLRLATLALPAAQAGDVHAGDVQAALAHGAVRLYVERVRAFDARFTLTAENLAAVVDTCRRLDGLALAIELAAARVPALGVGGVRARLDEHLKLLGSAPRLAPARHRTLRAALDWSFGLLDGTEQALLRRLGVFAGGCAVEAVQAVCGDSPALGRSQAGQAPSGGSERGGGTDPLDEWTLLDALTALIDKSLVVAEGDERPRYRLLDSTRRYALERLAAAGEADVLARRHAWHVAAQLEQLADALYEGRLAEDAFVATRARELDNLRAALAWALGAHGDAALALALLAHGAPLAVLMPSYEECQAWTRTLAERVAGAALSPRQQALHTYVQLHWGVQQLRLAAAGASSAQPGAAALRALADTRRGAHAHCALALHALWRGDLAGARAALAAAAGLGAQHWPGWLRAQHLDTRIRIAEAAGEPFDAQAEIAGVLAQLQAEGDRDGRAAFALRTRLAVALVAQGRHDEAVEHLLSLAEQGRRQRRDAYRMCFVLAPLARALIELDRLNEASAVVLEALPLLRHTGLRADHAPDLALLAAKRGRPEVAAELLGAGDALLARAGGRRTAADERLRQRVLDLAAAALPPERIAQALAHGAALGAGEFERLASEAA